jgi:hypothetical protein
MACSWPIARITKKAEPVMDPYKVLQTILEKVRERAETARYSKNPKDIEHAILENQERIAEAVLILGAILQVIVDKQITVTIQAPPKGERS